MSGANRSARLGYGTIYYHLAHLLARTESGTTRIAAQARRNIGRHARRVSYSLGYTDNQSSFYDVMSTAACGGCHSVCLVLKPGRRLSRHIPVGVHHEDTPAAREASAIRGRHRELSSRPSAERSDHGRQCCAVAPTAPSGFGVSSNAAGNVSFAWNASAGAGTYVIEAGTAAGSSNLVAAADLGSATNSYTTSGVGAGLYYVRLRARNACGTSGPSNEVTLVVK